MSMPPTHPPKFQKMWTHVHITKDFCQQMWANAHPSIDGSVCSKDVDKRPCHRNFKRCGQMSMPPTSCRVARSPRPGNTSKTSGRNSHSHVTVLTWLAVDVAPGAPSISTCYSTHELLKRTGSVVTLGVVSCAVDGNNVVISHRNGIAKRICTGIGSGGRQHHEVLGHDCTQKTWTNVHTGDQSDESKDVDMSTPRPPMGHFKVMGQKHVDKCPSPAHRWVISRGGQKDVGRCPPPPPRPSMGHIKTPRAVR